MLFLTRASSWVVWELCSTSPFSRTSALRGSIVAWASAVPVAGDRGTIVSCTSSHVLPFGSDVYSSTFISLPEGRHVGTPEVQHRKRQSFQVCGGRGPRPLVNYHCPRANSVLHFTVTTLRSNYDCCAHFKDEEIEAQKGWVTCPRSLG